MCQCDVCLAALKKRSRVTGSNQELGKFSFKFIKNTGIDFEFVIPNCFSSAISSVEDGFVLVLVPLNPFRVILTPSCATKHVPKRSDKA